ncbi:MAG: hypothetical protein Q4E34_02700, partial [Synergistaceae bacterium]|nr:hypothetical protein [Synergistaceae bacterium]
YIADIITGDVMNSGITAAKVQKYDAYEAQKADKATTLSGYGIADAYTKTVADAKFAGNATTLSGYGIADAYTKTAADAKFAGKATTLAGYGITDAYTTEAADAKFAGKATTLSGYGIADAYTKTAADAKFAGKATTLAGYGITDAYTKAETETKLGQKASASALAEAQERIAIDEGLIDYTMQNVAANAAHIAEIITGDVMNSGITAAKVQKYDAYEARKADKATTLSGYGIADAYTKTELYTKSETEGKIADAVSGISPTSKYAADSGAAEINNAKTLTVAGGTNIETALTETGGNAKITVKLKDDITVGSIAATGGATVGGTLSAGGNLAVAGTSDFTGAATFHSGADMGGRKITNLAAGSANTDAANYGQLIGSFVQDTATGAVKAVTNAGTEMTVAQLQDAAISSGRITTGSDGTKYLTLTKKDRYTGVTTDIAGIDLTGITSTITIGGTTAPLTNGDNIEFKDIYEANGTTVKQIAIGLQKDITLKSIKLNTGGEYIWLDEDGVSISDRETGSANFSGLNSTALYTGKSEISADGDVISSEIYSGLSQDSLMVGKKYYITSAGINANELKITNVADGEIAAGSKDAANAGQLYSEQLARIAGDTITTSGSYYVSGVSTISAISSLDAQVKLNENAILANSNSITSLQTTKADKATTLAGYGITNAYTKAEANDKFALKAETLAGYGITDAYTTAAADAKFAQKATTLAGYGITDAYTKNELYTKAEANDKFALKA